MRAFLLSHPRPSTHRNGSDCVAEAVQVQRAEHNHWTKQPHCQRTPPHFRIDAHHHLHLNSTLYSQIRAHVKHSDVGFGDY